MWWPVFKLKIRNIGAFGLTHGRTKVLYVVQGLIPLTTLTPEAEVMLPQVNQPIARLVKIKMLEADGEPDRAAGLLTLSPDLDESFDLFDQGNR